MRTYWLGRLALAALLAIPGCEWFDTLFGPGRDLPSETDNRFVWRRIGYDNRSTPWADDTSVYFLGRAHQLTAVDKDSGRVRWSIVLPVQRVQTVGFGGVVTNGKLIVGDQDIFAIDSRDGTILWRFAPVDGVDIGRVIPVLWNGLIFGGSSNGWLFAVDVETGQQQWRTRLGTGTFLTWASVVVDGTLYVGSTDFDIAPNNEPQGSVAALDALTGAVSWQREIPHHVDPSGPTATITPVVAGDVLVAGARDGPVYAFDRASGSIRWKMQPFPIPQASIPAHIRDVHALATCGDVVFVGSTSTLVAALDARSGQEFWRTAGSLASADGVSCDGRSVFVMRPLGGLQVIDAATGQERWEIGYPDNDFWTGVLTEGDRVYGGGMEGLYALRYD